MLMQTQPRLNRTDAELYGDDLIEMAVAANQFMKARNSLIKRNGYWDDIFNGIDAADFENPNIVQEVNRWLNKLNEHVENYNV